MELISREEVIKIIRFFRKVCMTDEHSNKGLFYIANIMFNINLLPTLENRPRGEWEEYNGYNPRVERALRRCSYCKRFKIHVVSVDKFNFCPHCGADMRMEEEK